MQFICYTRCTTCKRARVWLDEHGLTYASRDIKEDNPTEAELKAWYEMSGLPLSRFWNTSGMQYRAHNLKEKRPTMGEAEQIDFLATDGMLVKRPVLVGDDFVLVGFKEAEWAAKLL